MLEAYVNTNNMCDKIKFVGWVKRDELPQFYRNADVFVLPSMDEGMPQVVMEAMAAGLPVIATSVGGTVDLIQNNYNGILVSPANFEELKKSIIEIINNPVLLENMRRLNLEISSKRTWEIVTEEYSKLLNSA